MLARAESLLLYWHILEWHFKFLKHNHILAVTLPSYLTSCICYLYLFLLTTILIWTHQNLKLFQADWERFVMYNFTCFSVSNAVSWQPHQDTEQKCNAPFDFPLYLLGILVMCLNWMPHRRTLTFSSRSVCQNY